MEAKDISTVENTQKLDYVLRELDSLKAGLASLGLKQCSCCRKFFQCPDGKSLLNAGQLVCYRCVEGWWQQRSPTLTIGDRKTAEHLLLRWLVAHYGAKVIRQTKQMPPYDAIELKIVVGCEHCNGTGQKSNGKCQNCDGRGNEWVVVLKPESQ